MYGFVNNSPVNFCDHLGLLVIEKKKRIVHVGKCEIVVLYGHSLTGKKKWKWKSNNAATAGAAVMCWPESNSDGVPNDLFDIVFPNRAELSQSLDIEVDWTPSEDNHDDEGIYPKNKLWNANYLLAQIRAAAWRKAREFCACSKCQCKQVRVRFVRIGSASDIEPDPVNPNPGKPQPPIPYIQSYSLDCKTHRWSWYTPPSNPVFE